MEGLVSHSCRKQCVEGGWKDLLATPVENSVWWGWKDLLATPVENSVWRGGGRTC